MTFITVKAFEIVRNILLVCLILVPYTHRNLLLVGIIVQPDNVINTIPIRGINPIEDAGHLTMLHNPPPYPYRQCTRNRVVGHHSNNETMRS